MVLLSLILAGSAWAAPVHNMFFLEIDASGFFVFEVDGIIQRLLCDQFNPNVTTLPYKAVGYSLADLSGTTLGLAGDPNALHKYQEVAILDLLAYANPSLAADVVKANRIIVDGSGQGTPAVVDLLNFVATQNPADYPQLANFIIFVNPITQEQTGFVPEPRKVSFALFGVMVAAMLLKHAFRHYRTVFASDSRARLAAIRSVGRRRAM